MLLMIMTKLVNYKEMNNMKRKKAINVKKNYMEKHKSIKAYEQNYIYEDGHQYKLLDD